MNDIYLELVGELEKKLDRPLKKEEMKLVQWMVKEVLKEKHQNN